MSEQEVALFPLNTVLFPGGPLRLRIFEARYLDMVSECLRNDRGFGVCLIRSGTEAGTPAETVEIGTLARIVDWSRLDDGLLGITARGEDRFRVLRRTVRPNNLIIGTVSPLTDERKVELPDQFQSLANLVKQLTASTTGDPDPSVYEDAAWVGYRLSELLPIPLSRKQRFLELADPIDRLSELADIVRLIGESG